MRSPPGRGADLYAHAIVLTRALPFGDELSLIPFLDLANHANGAKNSCSIGVATKPDAAEDDSEAAGATIKPVVDQSQLDALGAGEEVTAVLTAGTSLKPGEQTFIDYGEAGWRSSWEMLYTYGFVPGASPARPTMIEGGTIIRTRGIALLA